MQGAASMVWRLAGGTKPLYKEVITIMRVIVFIYQFLISLIMNLAGMVSPPY